MTSRRRVVGADLLESVRPSPDCPDAAALPAASEGQALIDVLRVEARAWSPSRTRSLERVRPATSACWSGPATAIRRSAGAVNRCNPPTGVA